ncbi:MAG: sugar phosphate isomerase/epimerase [Lachnospiraceae bacterium]|nr:sugar phosphate isomerase/epimerase [Lachnospiraceae bacterium]
MRNVRIGCPAFILRDLLYEDFAGTMEKVGKIGFDGIELIGFFGHPAEEIRDICLSNRLEPFGCFVILPDLLCEDTGAAAEEEDPRSLMTAMKAPGRTPDEKFSYIKEIGCSYISLGIPREQTAEEFAGQVKKLLPCARKYGMAVQYHNHGYEYVKDSDGTWWMDRILEKCPREMLFEPDLGWMGIAGCDWQDGIRRHTGRIKAMHMKDYYRSGKNRLDASKEHVFLPTGYGVMDWTSILEYCEKEIRPDWYVCDHDKAYDGDIIEELRLSFRFLKKKLEYLSAECGD